MFINFSFSVFSHQPTRPYLSRKNKDMGEVFDIIFPRSWAELKDLMHGEKELWEKKDYAELNTTEEVADHMAKINTA